MEQYKLVNDFSYLVGYSTTSFIICIIFFKVIGPALSSRLTKSYNGLSQPQKMDWNDRLISNLNAVVSIALSAYTLLFDTEMHKDYIWYDCTLARVACSSIIGYMIADMVVMLVWCSVSRGELLGFISHHIVTVWAYYYVSVNGVLCYFAMLRMIAEVSTPNMNQRWYFDICGVPRTNLLVLLNGFAMLLSFFLFRIVLMPVFWFRIVSVSGTPASAALGHIQLIMYLPCIVLDSLNLIWFYKMCRGFAKAVQGLIKSKQDHLA